MRRLVADEGERGEDQSDCTGDCSQELSRRINPVTASPNAVSNQRRGIEPTRAAPAARASDGLPTPSRCVRSLGCSGCVPPSVRRRPNDRSSGPLSPPALAKSAGFRSTLESGVRSAVIIPMRQQPGPMLIFRLTEDRRSRLDVGRHGGNPHSVPGAPVIPLRRHHEQLKNTRAVRGHTFQTRHDECRRAGTKRGSRKPQPP